MAFGYPGAAPSARPGGVFPGATAPRPLGEAGWVVDRPTGRRNGPVPGSPGHRAAGPGMTNPRPCTRVISTSRYLPRRTVIATW